MPYLPPHLREGSHVQPEAPPEAHQHGGPGTREGRGGGRGGRGQRAGRAEHEGGGGRGRGGRGEASIKIQNARGVQLRVFLRDEEEGGEGARPGLRRFVLVPHLGRSYAHLESLGQLFVLAPAEEAQASVAGSSTGETQHLGSHQIEVRETGSAEISGEERSSTEADAESAGRGSKAEGEREGAAVSEEGHGSGPEGREAEEGGASLVEEVNDALGPALERVHLLLGDLAASQLRRSTVERAKLVVRLGRLLFTLPPGASEEDVPPFTRAQFEAYMQRRAPALAVPLRRHLETSLEEGVFEALERLALGPAMHKTTRVKYNIAVEDKEQLDMTYKITCVRDGEGIKLRRVKSSPVRQAVVDVARPERETDFRVMLWTETYYTTLTAEAHEALQLLVSSAVVDPDILGGLRWPEGVETGAATARGRFAVVSVRAIETTRVASHGSHWKLKRVSGREVGLGRRAAEPGAPRQHQGRLSREAEYVPAAWREQLKRGRVAHLTFGPDTAEEPRRDAAPEWTPDSILQELPEVLQWIDSASL